MSSEDLDYEESSESEVYSEYTDSDRSADEVSAFESSEYDGDDNEGDLSESKAGGLNENESEVGGGSSGNDRSEVEGDSAEIVLSGD